MWNNSVFALPPYWNGSYADSDSESQTERPSSQSPSCDELSERFQHLGTGSTYSIPSSTTTVRANRMEYGGSGNRAPHWLTRIPQTPPQNPSAQSLHHERVWRNPDSPYGRVIPAENDASASTSEGSKNITSAQSYISEIRRDLYNRAKLKSGNKKKGRYSARNEEKRIDAADEEIGRIRGNEIAKDRREAIWKGNAHNCSELADAAFYLAQDKGISAQRVQAESHDYTVIGDSISDAEMPKKIGELPDHLAICDPWANIACGVKEYPDRFNAKMRKWEEEGTEIYDFNQSEWVKPTNEEWIKGVLENPQAIKIEDTLQGESEVESEAETEGESD